jgi:hypothetical protein
MFIVSKLLARTEHVTSQNWQTFRDFYGSQVLSPSTCTKAGAISFAWSGSIRMESRTLMELCTSEGGGALQHFLACITELFYGGGHGTYVPSSLNFHDR